MTAHVFCLPMDTAQRDLFWACHDIALLLHLPHAMMPLHDVGVISGHVLFNHTLPALAQATYTGICTSGQAGSTVSTAEWRRSPQCNCKGRCVPCHADRRIAYQLKDFQPGMLKGRHRAEPVFQPSGLQLSGANGRGLFKGHPCNLKAAVKPCRPAGAPLQLILLQGQLSIEGNAPARWQPCCSGGHASVAPLHALGCQRPRQP